MITDVGKSMLPPSSTHNPSLPLMHMRAVIEDDQYACSLLNSYAKLVEQARYARYEPTEDDAENVEYVLETLQEL